MHNDAQTFNDDPRLREMHERLSQLGASWRKIPLPVGSATRRLESVAAQGRVNSHQHDARARSAQKDDTMQQETVDIATSDSRTQLPKSHRGRVFVAAALVTVIVVLGAALFAALKNSRSSVAAGYRQLPDTLSLLGVDMVSTTDGWVIGSEFNTTSLKMIGYVLHYHNGVWKTELTIDRLPAGLSMDSANDGWMVTAPVQTLTGGSQAPSDGSQIYHYHNGSWREVVLPGALANEYVNLDLVRMISSNDGWIEGYGIVLHYEQGAWTQISFPDPSISIGPVLSDQEAWGVKGVQDIGGTIPATIYHYFNGEWHPYQLASSGVVQYLIMYSSTDGWANVNNTNDSSMTTFRYDGASWSAVRTIQYTASNAFDEITPTGPDECWEVDQFTSSTAIPAQPDKIVHIQGSQITVLALPDGIISMYAIEQDASGDLWAMGVTDRLAKSGNLAAILTYRNGAWVIWQSQ